MQSYFEMMHSTGARAIRLVGGLGLLVYSAELSVWYAIALAIVGTAIAVTGIVDICPMELVINGVGSKSPGPHQRAA
jgi:hypothetical protein